jgi:hypothetical protein
MPNLRLPKERQRNFWSQIREFSHVARDWLRKVRRRVRKAAGESSSVKAVPCHAGVRQSTMSGTFATAAPPKVYAVKGMLSRKERDMLYTLARDRFTDSGAVIDAGALFGASTVSLAAGLADRRAEFIRPPLHSYDHFLIDEYIRAFLLQKLQIDRQIGDSFYDLYQRNIEPYRHLISLHRGDLLSQKWTADDIEILFLDVCKSPQLNSHVLQEFLPHLIPGLSVFVQQDYHHPHLPWIHVTMEALNRCFEVETESVGESIVCRFVNPPTEEELDACITYSFSPTEQVALIDSAIERLAPQNRGCVALAKAILCLSLFGHAAAEKQLAELLSVYSEGNVPFRNWNVYVEQVRRTIAISNR